MHDDFEENYLKALGAQESLEKRVILDGYYEIASNGIITRLKGGSGAAPGRTLRWQRTTDGYASVALSVQGEDTRYRVHRLVAEAFLGPGEPGLQVNHIDGNILNNCVENLEWATPQENTAHAAATGLMPLGSARSHSKLNEESAGDILRAFKEGVSNGELSKQYDLSPSTIHSLVRRKTWKHVPDDSPLPTPPKNYKSNAKLSLAQAREIRIAYDSGDETQESLAQRYGISRADVSKIITGNSWPEDDYEVTNRGNHRKASRGSANGNSKLDDESVRLIRRLRREGWPYQKIAAHVGTDRVNVSLICRGKTWQHVDDEGEDWLTDDSSQRRNGSDLTPLAEQLEFPGLIPPLRHSNGTPLVPPSPDRITTNGPKSVQLSLLPLDMEPERSQGYEQTG